MHEHKCYLDKTINRKTLAADFLTNEKYIAKAVHEGAGTTFHEYINSLRLAYACDLLSDLAGNDLIVKIADESGFSNRFSFYRHFVAKYGISPTEFREMKKK